MTCYRHPDREAFVRCQRCERFICPECQVESSVGFLCPDDAGGTATKLNRQRVKASREPRPVASISLIVACVIVAAIQFMLGDVVSYLLGFAPAVTAEQPWRLITSAFVHDGSSPFHLLVNMYSLYIFGQVLEPMLGRARFLALYFISALAGSVMVLWFAGPTELHVGASGAIFGLMAAYFVVLRSIGANSGQMLGLIAINIVFGFMPGISWEGHIGGLIGGGLVALVYSRTRSVAQSRQQKIGLVAIVIALIVLTALGVSRLAI